MILGSHLILTTYGFWLPNDPRGSWSKYVGNEHLFDVAGRATTTTERRSLAGRGHDRVLRAEAKRQLQRRPVVLDGQQALAVANGFGRLLRFDGITVWASAILPDHVHLVIARHDRRIEDIARRLKASATQQLSAEGRHPFGERVDPSRRAPTPWARGEWKVFLDTRDDISRAIRYVELNPVKEGKPPQLWSFVTPYEPHV